MTDRTATRAAGEARMAAFVPRMGRRYANGRNTDEGPGQHKAVSQLSPYLRRRLVLEADVVAAALAARRDPATVVIARSYSRSSGRTLEDSEIAMPGNISAAISAIRFSCLSFV